MNERLRNAIERIVDGAIRCEMDEGPDMVDGITYDEIEELRAALAELDTMRTGDTE